MKTLLEQEGEDAFRRPELFRVCLLLLNNDLSEEFEDIIPNRATRLRAREDPTNDHALYHGYLLRSKIDDSLALVKDNIIMILDNLIQRLDHRLESVIEDPVIKSIAIFLDTKSYSIIGLAEVQDSIKVLHDKFSALLRANGFNLDLLNREFEALFEHVNLFLSQKESQTVWPHVSEPAQVRNI